MMSDIYAQAKCVLSYSICHLHWYVIALLVQRRRQQQFRLWTSTSKKWMGKKILIVSVSTHLSSTSPHCTSFVYSYFIYLLTWFSSTMGLYQFSFFFHCVILLHSYISMWPGVRITSGLWATLVYRHGSQANSLFIPIISYDLLSQNMCERLWTL